MPKNQTLDEFYSTFREEVLCASDTETSGWTTEDFLTNVMMEYLEEAGEVTDPVICPFRGYGLQMNAYAISEDCESVDIFVSIYSESDRPRSVSQADIDAAIKRAIQLYHKAINDLYTAFQKDNDTYEFAITLHQNKDNIKHVRICALTNGLVKPIALKNITIGDAEISFSLWDVDRLYRCVTSGKMRETIEIDFVEKFQTSIPCIENNTSKKYSVYLAIINGDLLAALYDEFRDRLLEKNVRSFLQVKGGVNKGIRDTLRDEPDMFLAYNNGISVTAESVEIVRDENGKPSIKRIRDTVNCRNTKPICKEIETVTGFKAPHDLWTKVDGPPVQYLTWSTMESQCRKLKAVLKQLADSHIEPEKITILSPQKREDSVVSMLNGYVVKDFSVPPGMNTTFCTIQAYKGLENSVIILTDIEGFSAEKLMYVGLSRACTGLYVLESDSAKREYDNLLMRRLFNE